MQGTKLLIRLLLVLSLFTIGIHLALAQNGAIRQMNIQIPDQGQIELYQSSHALVIGISEYQDNAWVDLESVGADVEAVRETLEEQGFAVETLLNPTKNRLLNS